MLAALVVSSQSRVAVASGKALPEIELRYEVASSVNGCPSARELVADIERELRTDPFRAGAPLRVSVAIDAQGRKRLVGRVVFSGVASADPELPWNGEETFRASDCTELARTIALVVTLAVERLESARARHVEQQASLPPPDMASDVEPPSGGIAAPAAPPRPRARAPRPSSRWAESPLRVSTSAGAVAASHLTPGAALGASFGASLGVGRASIELEALLFAPSRAASRRGGAVAVSMRALAVAACYSAPILPRMGVHLEARACPVVAPLLLRGVGEALAVARPRELTSLALGGRLAMGTILLNPIRLEVILDALAPLTRHVFAIDDEAVWTQPALGFAAHVNLAVRFR